MKLILLGVILILVLLVVGVFYKENFDSITGFNDDYTISNNPSYNASQTEFSLTNDSLGSYRGSPQSGKLNEVIKGGSLMIYEEPERKPLSHLENSAIIDPDAADLEAARSRIEDATLTDAAQKYANADQQLKNNFLSVSKNDPIYKVAAFTTNESTTKDNVMNVCAGFNWKTETGTSDGGWSRVPLAEKPCVGFFSHTGSRQKNEDGQYVEKWTILVSCDEDDCDAIDPALKPLQSSLDKMPADGETIWPGYPSADVDKVWRVKSTAEGGNVKTRGRVSLETSFEEVTSVQNVEIGEELKEEEAELTEVQALNKCGIRGLKTKDGNECVGVALKDGRYRYLYKSVSKYEPTETIGQIFRKLIWGSSKDNVDYPPVTTDDPVFSSRSILKTSVKEEYTNYLDKDSENLIFKNGLVKAKQYCNNDENCIGYYSQKTDPEKYFFLKNASKQYKVGVDGISKIFMFKEKDDSGKDTRYGKIKKEYTKSVAKQDKYIQEQKLYFASLATIKQYYDANITGESVILDGYQQGDYTKLKSSLTDCHIDLDKRDANGRPINYSIFPENSTAFAKGDKLRDMSDPSLGKYNRPLCIGIAVEKTDVGGNKYHFMRFRASHQDAESAVVKEIAPGTQYNEVYLHKSHYKQGAISSATSTIIMVRDTITTVYKQVNDSLYRLSTLTESARKTNISSGVDQAITEIAKMYTAYGELNTEIANLKGQGQTDEDIENLYTTQWKSVRDTIKNECETIVAQIVFFEELAELEDSILKMFNFVKTISNTVLNMKEKMVNRTANAPYMKSSLKSITGNIRDLRVQKAIYEGKYQNFQWSDIKIKRKINNKFSLLGTELRDLWDNSREKYIKGYTDDSGNEIPGLYQIYVICKEATKPIYFYEGDNIKKYCYGKGTGDDIITNAYSNHKTPRPDGDTLDWRCINGDVTGGTCSDNVLSIDDLNISVPLEGKAIILQGEAEKLSATYTSKAANFGEILKNYEYNPTDGIERIDTTRGELDLSKVPADYVYGNLEYALKQCNDAPWSCVGVSKIGGKETFTGTIKEGFTEASIDNINDEDKGWGFFKLIGLARTSKTNIKHDTGNVKKIWRHSRYTDTKNRLDKSYPNCKTFCAQQLGLNCIFGKDADGNLVECDAPASPTKIGCTCLDLSAASNKSIITDSLSFASASCPDRNLAISYCTGDDGNLYNYRNIKNDGTRGTVTAECSGKVRQETELECVQSLAAGLFSFPDNDTLLAPENNHIYNTGNCLNGGVRKPVENNILQTASAADKLNPEQTCKNGCHELGAQFIKVEGAGTRAKCICTRCLVVNAGEIETDPRYQGGNVEFSESDTGKVKCEKIGKEDGQKGVLHYFFEVFKKNFTNVKIYSTCKTDEEKAEEERLRLMARWTSSRNIRKLSGACENFKYSCHPTYRITEKKAEFMIYFKVSDIGPFTDDFELFNDHILTNQNIIAFMKKKSDGKFYALESKDDDDDKTTNTIYTIGDKTYYYEGYISNFSSPPIKTSEELDGFWRNNYAYYQAIHTNNTNVNDTSLILDNMYICGKGGFNTNSAVRNACETDHTWCRNGSAIVTDNIEERARNQRIKSRNIENIWGNTLAGSVNLDAQSWWNENKYSVLRSACKLAASKDEGETAIRNQSFDKPARLAKKVSYWEDNMETSNFANSSDLAGNWDEYLKMRQSPCYPFNFTNNERACFSPENGLITQMNDASIGDNDSVGNFTFSRCGPPTGEKWTKSRVNYWRDWWWNEVCKGSNPMWSESRKLPACSGPHPNPDWKSDEQIQKQKELEEQRLGIYCPGYVKNTNGLVLDTIPITMDGTNTNIPAQTWKIVDRTNRVYEGEGLGWSSRSGGSSSSGKYYARITQEAGLFGSLWVINFYKTKGEAQLGNNKITVINYESISMTVIDTFYKRNYDAGCDFDSIKTKKNSKKKPAKYYAFRLNDYTDEAFFDVAGTSMTTFNEKPYPSDDPKYSDPNKKYSEVRPLTFANIFPDDKSLYPDFVGKKEEQTIQVKGMTEDEKNNAFWQSNVINSVWASGKTPSLSTWWICKEGNVKDCIDKFRGPNAICSTYSPPVGYKLKTNASSLYCAGETCDVTKDRDTCADQITDGKVGDHCELDVNCDGTLVCKD